MFFQLRKLHCYFFWMTHKLLVVLWGVLEIKGGAAETRKPLGSLFLLSACIQFGLLIMLAAWVLSENMSCSICTASQLAAPTDIFAKDHKKTTHSRERPRTPRAVHLLIPTVRGQRRKPKNLFFAKKALVAFFPRPISAFFEIYKMFILLHRSNLSNLANFV